MTASVPAEPPGPFEMLGADLPSLTEIDGLRARYSPDDAPFEQFYVPMLSKATAYDRAVGYWSAAELQYAAQGTAHFIANGGKMRLIVGAQLIQKDVDAVLSGAPLDDVVAARLLADPGLDGARIVKSDHLAVLAWMVANGTLEIKVGIPCEGDRLLTFAESGRYFHTKYGVFSDAHGNQVAFTGSNNASVTAWVRNHETFDVYPSWNLPVWEWNGREAVRDFERHWNSHPDTGWAVVPLPLAVREHLVHNAPPAPPLPPGATLPAPPPPEVDRHEIDEAVAWTELVELAREPTLTPYTAVGAAWVAPLPHQAELVNRAVITYPRGYLFADEVGLGKTVEAGLVLRELLLSGAASKALLLVPASVMKQWQEELHEKMNLDVPRYDNGGFLDRHDQPVASPAGAKPWSAFPIVLASSHLARRRNRRSEILDAGPWDVVLVDEAHHARRRGSKPTETPNALLALLLDMRDRGMWKALYLASATPMQMNAHEAWDLLSLLNLTGRWGESAKEFLRYFQSLRADVDPKTRDWGFLCGMLHDYFTDPVATRDLGMEADIESDSGGLGFVGAMLVTNMSESPPSKAARSAMPNETSSWMDKWLRRHTPMRDRVFRNTRTTLREYQAAGIISADVIIPKRHVDDQFIPLADAERKMYERIEEYIRRHYNAYKSNQAHQALGFIMTIYRRRLTSSFEAIRQSLQRRLQVLQEGRALADLLADDDALDLDDALFDADDFDNTADLLSGEITELRAFLAELDTFTGEDTKASRLVSDLNQALLTYASAVVFTQYTDTMDYIRERLVAAGYDKIGCYSGRGGEIYNPNAQEWRPVTKASIKQEFRDGKLTVLIGTDSMSEGLNLQTSGRLINYDMPWNLMRVEQRIGRVDRIGASYRDIQVSNYFYADTIEEQVYKGITEDYADFTDIVGDAAPVLASVEKAIEHLALRLDTTGADIDHQVGELRGKVDDLTNAAVKPNDLGSPPDITGTIAPPPTLVGDVTLSDIERTLTTNPLTAPLLTPVAGRDRVWTLQSPVPVRPLSLDPTAGTSGPDDYASSSAAPIHVTFDRVIADTSADDVTLLTYGTPELEALLPQRSHWQPPTAAS